MNQALRNGVLWILGGIFTILVGQVLLVRNQNLGPELVLKREAIKVQEKINAAKDLVDSKLGDLRKLQDFDQETSAVKSLTNGGVDVFVFKDNKAKFWTSNAYNVISSYGRGNAVQIQKHASRYIVLWTYYSDTQELIFGKEIIANPEFKFVSGNSLQEERHNKFSITPNPVEGSMPVMSRGAPLFYIVIEQFSPGIGFDLIVLLGIVFITLGVFVIFFKSKFWYLSYVLGLTIWLLAEFVFYKNISLWNIKNTSLFAPEVYASSWYFPNLGVLLVNALLGFVGVNFLFKLLRRNAVSLKKWYAVFLRIFLLLLVCAFSYFFLLESGFLVRDSSIVFDFHEIHRISKFTVLGLIGVALGYGILLRLIQMLHLLGSKPRDLWLNLFPVVTMAIYLFVSHEKMTSILLLLLTGGLLITEHLVRGKRPLWYIGMRLLLPCIALSFIFNVYVDKKEVELREILAARLLLQNEREPTALLSKTQAQLQADKGIVDYYTCTDISKSDFEKRLRQLYFTEYGEDFELFLFDFNPNGNGYREENVFDYITLNTMYGSDACKPVTSNFSMVNERKLKGSFLGKFPVSDNGSWYGTYFVLLKPRLSASQGRLSDVFQKSPLEALFTENQYSYAFYSGSRLSRRYGQYNYPNNFNFKGQSNLQKLNGFSHFIYSDDLGNLLLISKPLKSWLQELTAFTILVLSCLLVALLYFLIVLLRQYSLSVGKTGFTRLRLVQMLRNRSLFNSGSGLFLSSKLQLYVILVVFVTFLVVLFVTINYFKNSYSLRQRESLWNKTNDIANAFGNQANLDALFYKNQTGLVYDLSNYYSTDINVYDASGRLLVSSNDRIYDQNIIGSLMNPGVYRDFRTKAISGFIHEEGIGDLNYISAYYTIFDNDLNVKGYLNLPYFTNRQDLYREISNYSTTLINLFALVFALAALVAYVIAHRITEPLNLIRRQMGLVKLGAKNAPISWQHNDEIGLLIAEYNKMINELEESSNKLAEGERQGAWREMAKQVAHEIKNPLTPMKLSLQHLQYAIQRNDPNIETKIKKTTELLINQIDSLSKMAEEFSAFAKMPEAQMEPVVLNDILDESVQLFEKEENCTIIYNPLTNWVKVNVDPHQLGRVFANILKNGIQAIPEGAKGEIKVYCKLNEGKITIYFEDNGKGITDELGKKIFSPNFSTKNSGMGLGLAISRKIIEQFSGVIDYTSIPEKGSTFYVVLPVIIN